MFSQSGSVIVTARDLSMNQLIEKFGPNLPLLFKLHEIWSVDSQKKIIEIVATMSDFKAKMHQIQFRLGLCPRPRWGSL